MKTHLDAAELLIAEYGASKFVEARMGGDDGKEKLSREALRFEIGRALHKANIAVKAERLEVDNLIGSLENKLIWKAQGRSRRT